MLRLWDNVATLNMRCLDSVIMSQHSLVDVVTFVTRCRDSEIWCHNIPQLMLQLYFDVAKFFTQYRDSDMMLQHSSADVGT